MSYHSKEWIGVLGGGQLGRMLTLEARRMGLKVLKWTGGDRSGAAHIADLVFEEEFDDQSAMERFIDRVDVATVEFENVPRDLLESIEQRMPLMPNSRAVGICQHREREKRFLSENGFPCARFEVVNSAESLIAAKARLGGDTIIKSAEFGYDGKGQKQVPAATPDDELRNLWNELGFPAAVVEERINLSAELSVIVARGRDGAVATYDPVENHHRNHILDYSVVPGRIPQQLQATSRQIAVEIAESLEYIGVLAVEFFVTGEGEVLVNEMAPRPHNSGHHTFNACETSQFEQQVRAIMGFPLGGVRTLQPAVMWNLLGDIWEAPDCPPDWSPILSTAGASLHLYGKSEARPGRKMGHVTFLAETIESAIEKATTCREAFGQPPIAAVSL